MHVCVRVQASSRAGQRGAGARSALRQLLPRRSDLLVDVAAVDRIAVPGERAGPRADRVLPTASLREHVAVMILDDGVGRQLVGGALHMLEREIELAVLVVRPADAVEE